MSRTTTRKYSNFAEHIVNLNRNIVDASSKWISVFIYISLCNFLLFIFPARSQTPDVWKMSPAERSAYFEKIGSESYQTWHRTVILLHIWLPDSLPPPAVDPARPEESFQKNGSNGWTDSSGNTYTRSAWGTWNNYNEAKANPYPIIPDPLMTESGQRVKDASMWWNVRRPEIARDFDEEIFGRIPDSTPRVRWEVVTTRDTTIAGISLVTRELAGHVDNSIDTAVNVDIRVALTLPQKTLHPVPVIMEFGFGFPAGFKFPGMAEQVGPTWEEQVLAKGWGYAVYDPTSVQADNAAGLTQGIIGLMNRGGDRKPDDWGALRAWAWGASRILDYLETDNSVDAEKVAIEGVSRYGKAVLVAMAYDQRFAAVCVGSSGKGGATLYRRNYGESMGNICSSGEYHWFAGNLLKYVLAPEMLSVDSHELIDMCAPRPVFVSCGSPELEGNWVDDTGQFMSEVAAGPVYELLGEKSLGVTTMPPIGPAIVDGTLAFRQHHGGHTIGPNWPYFLDFVQRYFNSSSKPDSR